jgi:hypothetical protein
MFRLGCGAALGCLLGLSELQVSSADTGAFEYDAQKLQRLMSLPLVSEATPDYTCRPADPTKPSKKLNDFHIRGTALGGWLVLEPWITPSLFYQFLGVSKRFGDDAKNHVGLDSLTFCTALGKEEANRQLRAHWDAWVTEDQIRELAKSGVGHLRIPVADWMFLPYEPFIGCWDGALEQLDRVLDLCGQYGIKALLDVHAVRRSQVALHPRTLASHPRTLAFSPAPSHPRPHPPILAPPPRPLAPYPRPNGPSLHCPFHCPIAPLPYCPTAPLPHCPTALPRIASYYRRIILELIELIELSPTITLSHYHRTDWTTPGTPATTNGLATTPTTVQPCKRHLFDLLTQSSLNCLLISFSYYVIVF